MSQDHSAMFVTLAQQFGLTVASEDVDKFFNLYNVAYQRGLDTGMALENVACAEMARSCGEGYEGLAEAIESRRHK